MDGEEGYQVFKLEEHHRNYDIYKPNEITYQSKNREVEGFLHAN